jgi:hypothetical protein
MRPARFTISAVLLAAALAVVTTAARSADSTRIRGDVKFYLDVRFPQPSGQGTFATSGAFTDSGTFVSFPAGPAPYGKVKVWRRFAGRRGSIVVQDVFSATETGSWTILSATGAYVGLRGHGTSIGMPVGTDVGPDILPPQRAIGVATGTIS